MSRHTTGGGRGVRGVCAILPNFFKGSQTQNTSSEKNAFEVFKLQNAKNGIFMNPEKKLLMILLSVYSLKGENEKIYP